MDTVKIRTHSFAKSGDSYFNVMFEQYEPRSPHKGSISSSYILEAAVAAMNMDEYFVERSIEIQNELGVDTTVWGLRFEDGKFSLEFYFYFPQKLKKHTFENLLKLINPYMQVPFTDQKPEGDYYILSFNIESQNIEGVNVYYSTPDPSRPILQDEETGLYTNTDMTLTTSYYFTPSQRKPVEQNIYYAFYHGIRDFYDIIERVYSCCRDLFPGEDPIIATKFLSFPYIYDADRNRFFHPFCITRKENAVGVYYKGFSVNQFLLFLKYHQYPDAFIAAIEQEKTNLSHLQFDIGIDFYLQNGQFIMKKTAYFGAF